MEAIVEAFGIDWRLFVIQMANFGVLLVVLRYFLYTPLLRMIEERRKTIQEGLTNAESAERKLANIGQERETTLTAAAQRAEAIVALAKDEGDKKEGKIIHDAQERSERIMKDATDRAEELKRQAIAESQAEIARLSVLGAEKVIRKQLS